MHSHSYSQTHLHLHSPCTQVHSLALALTLTCTRTHLRTHILINAAIACTRAFSRTSHSNLLAELGWDRLDARRNYYKLCLFHKIINGQTQPYLRTLVPARHAQLSNHNLRNRHQLIVPFTRLSSYSKSFIPSTTQLWNNLPTTLTSIGSSSSFKRRLKMNLQCKPNPIHQSTNG